MKVLLAAVVSVSLVVAIAPRIAAQWPDFPTPAVPLLPNGQPNLEGPVPRTADGKPDLSGIWAFRGAGARGQRGQGGGGRGAGPTDGGAAPAPPAAPAPAVGANAGPPLATFFDIGAGIPGGPPFQPWAADLRKQRMADNMKDNPDAHCLPLGLTQMHMH